MQLPYQFLQKSVNKQFKDLAFFQILKRKGPYIQRSLVKIQNDLFYKHKLSGTQMKNVTFIKEIRQTIAAYQVIINQIKNDFMMTELDSLGESIHRLFVQLLSIVSFFASIILKKQKLVAHDMKDINLEQLKQKQQMLKKIQEQQKLKLLQEKQKQIQRMKQMEKLKFNFRQLFKMQAKSQKENKLIESLWKTVVTENKNSVKQCMKIKDSQLNKIIKDSCEYLYKNHSELDNIVRLTKQDIVQGEKTLQGFGDKAHLLEQNEQKIAHMKKIAEQIVKIVRQKVYDKSHTSTQTNFTNIDHTKPYMTVKQLDQRRKMQVKLRNYEKTTKQRQIFIQQLQKRLRQTQQQLEIANQKLDRSQSDQQSNRSPNNSHSQSQSQSNRNKFTNLSGKGKHNFNSFKVNSKSPTIVNKYREASFTVGKKISKLSKNSQIQQPFYQKFSNRSSTTSKDFSLSFHHKNFRKSQRNGIHSNLDINSPAGFGQKRISKKYKIQQSNLVIEARSNQQISRISTRGRAQTEFIKNQIDMDEKGEDVLSIDDNRSMKAHFNQKNSNQQTLQNGLQKKQRVFQIVQSFKLNIRPHRLKRYLQSTYKHPLAQQKQNQNLGQSRLLKSSKLKKSTSQHQISRYFFQPLENIDRGGPQTFYKQHGKLIEIEKRKIISQYASREKQKIRNISTCDVKIRQKPEEIPQLNTISLIRLKNQKKSGFGKQNTPILKGCIKTAANSKRQSKKQVSTLLKKSSKKKTISFDVLPGQRQNGRRKFYQVPHDNNQAIHSKNLKNQDKINDKNNQNKSNLFQKVQESHFKNTQNLQKHDNYQQSSQQLKKVKIVEVLQKCPQVY